MMDAGAMVRERRPRSNAAYRFRCAAWDGKNGAATAAD
jgi:hypothetical protein